MKKLLRSRYIVLMLLLFVMLFAVAACNNSEAANPADTVLKSNVIYTVASEEPISGAIAIADNKIIAIGTLDEIEPYIAETTVVKDMGDQMIMPGFIDGHTHTRPSHTVVGVDLTGVNSLEKCADLVKSYIVDHPDKTFVMGGGWYAANWGGAEPNKKYLDAVAPNVPIALKDMDGHTMWCNSKALDAAGIDNEYAAEFNKNNSGKLIAVDENGEPTGYLKENGADKVNAIWPEFSTEDLETCINVWPTYGVTSVNAMSDEKANSDIYNQLEELNNSGRLMVRQFISIDPDALEEDILAAKERFNSDIIRLNALKLFMDGVGSTYTASMLTPYEGTNDKGPDPYYTAEQVKDYALKASKLGLAVHIHTCGDRAIREALDGYQMAKEAGVELNNMFSLEHWDCTNPDDIPRAAELGISCNITPDFLAPTANWGDNPYLKVYDDEVDLQMWRYGSLYKSGANVTFGTDFYWSSYNPMVQIYRAMERVTNDGKPVGGYEPEEKLTLKEALQCYTINGAKAIGMADKLGTLEAGKYADIIVLDHNILTASPEEIFNTKVVMTMMNGNVVYGE